jgi:hypothetical protein
MWLAWLLLACATNAPPQDASPPCDSWALAEDQSVLTGFATWTHFFEGEEQDEWLLRFDWGPHMPGIEGLRISGYGEPEGADLIAWSPADPADLSDELRLVTVPRDGADPIRVDVAYTCRGTETWQTWETPPQLRSEQIENHDLLLDVVPE